jgi:hypothetical protein
MFVAMCDSTSMQSWCLTTQNSRFLPAPSTCVSTASYKLKLRPPQALHHASKPRAAACTMHDAAMMISATREAAATQMLSHRTIIWQERCIRGNKRNMLPLCRLLRWLLQPLQRCTKHHLPACWLRCCHTLRDANYPRQRCMRAQPRAGCFCLVSCYSAALGCFHHQLRCSS